MVSKESLENTEKNLRPDFIEQCQCCLKRSAHGESAALRSEAISSMMEAVAGCTISRGMLYSIQNHQAIFRNWFLEKKNHNLHLMEMVSRTHQSLCNAAMPGMYKRYYD